MRISVAIALLMLMPRAALSHQPVMDMAPRWSGGYGFQIRQEYRASDDVLHGDDDAPDPFGRSRRVRTTWLEGVYTFRRERRVTFKLPWIDQETDTLRGGVAVHERGRGFGDLVLGVPFKSYFNERGRTGNFGITPSLRLPTGSTGDAYPVADRSWDLGLAASYSTETAKTYQFFELFYWSNGAGRRGINEGDELGLDINLGLHPYHDNATNSGLFVMLDISARYRGRGHNTTGTSGGRWLSAGPVLVAYRDNWMLRAELHLPVLEDVRGTQLSRGTALRIGLGVAF